MLPQMSPLPWLIMSIILVVILISINLYSSQMKMSLQNDKKLLMLKTYKMKW